MFVAHGVHEHGGRYAGFAHALVLAGYRVYAIDHIGHGRNGRQAYLCSVPGSVANLMQLVEQEHAAFAGVPLFIFGHSMGSIISSQAAHALTERHGVAYLAGLALSGFAIEPGPGSAAPLGLRCLNPLVRSDNAVIKRVVLALAVANSALNPKGPGSPLDMYGLTSLHASVVPLINSDALHEKGWISNHLSLEMVRAIEVTKAQIPQWRFHVLTCHGEDDSLTLLHGSRALMARAAAAASKQIKVYPGVRHEILNDTAAAQCTADILAFFAERLPPSRS